MVLCFQLYAEDVELVQVLTSENFDQFIQENKYVLVKFYAPWCGHCQQMAPEFQTAAEQLLAEKSFIKLAKVDCTEQKDIAEKYKISGFPTVIFFSDGLQIEYKNGRTKEDILSWLQKKTGIISQEITTNEDLEKIKSEHEVVVVYFGIGQNDDNFAIFNKVASLQDMFTYVHTFSESIAKQQEVSQRPSMIIFKQYDEARNDYTGSWDADTIVWFLMNQGIPSLMNFDEKSAELIFGQQKATIFLITKDDQNSQTALQSIEQVKDELKSKILICRAKFQDDLGERLTEYLGLGSKDLPKIIIMNFSETDLLKYFLQKSSDISKEDILQFYQDWDQNKLTPFYKSEPIPETNDQPVKIVVGKTFEEIVINSNSDVLLEFYATWCGHCQEFAPEYEQLASEFKNQEIVIAKIEATENEVAGQSPVEGFPTFRLFKKGNKQNYTEYSGERNLQSLKKFLVENMSDLSVQKDDL